MAGGDRHGSRGSREVIGALGEGGSGFGYALHARRLSKNSAATNG